MGCEILLKRRSHVFTCYIESTSFARNRCLYCTRVYRRHLSLFNSYWQFFNNISYFLFVPKQQAGDMLDSSFTQAGDMLNKSLSQAGDMIDNSFTQAGDMLGNSLIWAGDMFDGSLIQADDMLDGSLIQADDMLDGSLHRLVTCYIVV